MKLGRQGKERFMRRKEKLGIKLERKTASQIMGVKGLPSGFHGKYVKDIH